MRLSSRDPLRRPQLEYMLSKIRIPVYKPEVIGTVLKDKIAENCVYNCHFV